MKNVDNNDEEKITLDSGSNSSSQNLLDEKRVEICKFSSSNLSLSIVIVLWINYVLSLYQAVQSFDSEFGFVADIVSFTLEVAIGMLLPLAFYKLYRSSKKRNHQEVSLVFKLIAKYFDAIKILLTIAAVVGVLVSMFLNLPFTFAFIAILLIIGVYVLAVYILGIFKNFFSDMYTTYNRQFALVPSTHSIKIYLMIVTIMTIGLGLIGKFDAIQKGLDQTLTVFLISFLTNVLTLVYFIYYASQFENKLGTFNYHYKTKVEEAYNSEI